MDGFILQCSSFFVLTLQSIFSAKLAMSFV